MTVTDCDNDTDQGGKGLEMIYLIGRQKLKWERQTFLRGDFIAIPDKHPRLEAMLISRAFIPMTSPNAVALNSVKGRDKLKQELLDNPKLMHERAREGCEIAIQLRDRPRVITRVKEDSKGDGSSEKSVGLENQLVDVKTKAQ